MTEDDDRLKRFEQFLDEFDQKMSEHERVIQDIQKQQGQRVDSYNAGWNDAIKYAASRAKYSSISAIELLKFMK